MLNDRSRVPFHFPGRGRVELTIAQCRRLCPQETAALLAAARDLSAARERHSPAAPAAAAAFDRCFTELQAALVEEARRRLRPPR